MDKQKDETEQEFEYGTLEEAKRRFDKQLEERAGVYCPIKDGICDTGCECYKYPKIVNRRSKEDPFYECKKGFCTAYMLVGPT
jgi:hypothetical protein